jgi:hypothetical protein
MKRLPLALFVVVAFVAVTRLAGGQAGTSVECRNGECFVTASSSLVSISVGLVVFVAVTVIPRRATTPTPGHVGVLRIGGAVISDGLLVVVAFSALLALPMLLAEQFYIGSFRWSFSREFVRATDWVFIGIPVLVLFAVMFELRCAALRHGTPSFGQYLMGYTVLSEGEPLDFLAAHKRTGWAAGYLLLWPIYLLYRLLTKPQREPWDARFHTRAVRFEYS